MTQDEALTILKTGASVFLTGEPGSGKTHTVNRYVRYLRDRGIEPAITASTGIAATHIHGMTLHSWSGIGIRRHLSDGDITDIARGKFIARRIKKCRTLIIDEISMIDGDTLDMVEVVCRKARKSEEPWGGMQVVFVGDFFQLPPVSRGGDRTLFAFESHAWRSLSPHVCYLEEQYRQEDRAFLDVLGAIRRNEFDETHFERIEARLSMRAPIPPEVMRLYSHNANVDTLNARELARLPGKTWVFVMAERGPEGLVASLKKGCLSPERLELKEGAAVVCTKNNPNAGFVNGTLGTVVGFADESRYPIIETRGGKRITIEPMEWLLEEDGEPLARIIQIPLRLAWAMTIHKSQGMSLDAAVMDLSRVFEFGQGYVALSRVRTLEGVHLLGVSSQAFRVHPGVSEQDAFFRIASDEARDRYAGLSEEELRHQSETFVRQSGGEAASSEGPGSKDGKPAVGKKNRGKHPGSYRRWSEEEEAELRVLYRKDLSIAEIAALLDRQPGGIRSRLAKLGLSDDAEPA